MKLINALFLLIILSCIALPSASFAKEINRNILALIDGDEIKDDFDNEIAARAEMPLNHLGFKLTYIDVSKELPKADEMQKFEYIITWFTDNKLNNAEDYAKWMIKQLNNGKKLIVFDHFGFDIGPDLKPINSGLLDKFHETFLVSVDPDESTNSPLLVELAYEDPNIIGFERKLTKHPGEFEKIVTLDKKAKIFLKLKRIDTGDTEDAVFVHSKGAYVSNGYAVYQNKLSYQSRWIINPFEFFRAALDTDFPKPDMSTINGMRLFYSQIDGDGIRNLAAKEDEESEPEQCGTATYNEILSRYNLPITVSAVIGDILVAKGKEREKIINIFKKMFLLPNVEPASHGWAHPFVWTKKGRKMGVKTPGYKYSPQNEIGNSIDYINNNLVPKGKETNLFLWTGDCLPDEEAMQYIYEHDIMNLNGGDTRFDNEYPSYTYVSPLFRHVNGYLQYYTADSNENTYTNLWTGPFYGYKFAKETYQRTESPIRVKPIDIYYHFYSMEHKVSIDALKELYDWSLSQEITPVFASHFVKVLKGWLSTKITKVSPVHWIIEGNNDLRTIRFDHLKKNVSIGKSKGVIGFYKYQGSIYVHLDNGKKSEIVLTDAAPSMPYLQKANGQIKAWKSGSSLTGFKLNTIGRVQFVVAGLRKGKVYQVKVKGKTYKIPANNSGELFFEDNILENKFEWVDIVIQ